MEISVIGAGYVGLVTAACLSEVGFKVHCIDTNLNKIDHLNKGLCPIYEFGLQEMIKRNLNKRLFFSGSYDSLKTSDVCFICVGTPSLISGDVELKYVYSALNSIKIKSKKYQIVVIKSTVPPGTAKKVREFLGSDFYVVSNPEFLKEGQAVKDFMEPDRVIIGIKEENLEKSENYVKTVMSQLYAPFVSDNSELLFMSNESAEIVKYGSNFMLATRITVMNEISRLCDYAGANIDDVRVGIGSDNRIGNKFLYPGPGFGGSCFPKDVAALVYLNKNKKCNMLLPSIVIESNELQKDIPCQKVMNYFKPDNIMDKRFAVLGLAFKGGTDDIRESPSLTLIDGLLFAGAKVVGHDPEASSQVKNIYYEKIDIADSIYSACKKVDGIIIMSDWNEYKYIDFSKIDKTVIFDMRNILNQKEIKSLGFKYIGMGRN